MYEIEESRRMAWWQDWRGGRGEVCIAPETGLVGRAGGGVRDRGPLRDRDRPAGQGPRP